MYDVNQIHDPIGGMAERVKQEAEKQARADHGYLLNGGTTYAGAPLIRQPVAARIEDLANQAATAGRELTEAREEYQRAALVREQATKRFIAVTEALFQAIQEHREGTPEGVPYQG